MFLKKPYLLKLFIFSTTVFLTALNAASSTEDFTILNGPSVGLTSPTESNDDGLSTEGDIMLAGKAGFIFGNGPFFLYIAGEYGRGGYSEKLRNAATGVDYDRFTVEVTVGYRLKSTKPFSFHYCGRASYDVGRRERFSSGVYYYWYSGPEAEATIYDDGDLSTFHISGGPALVIQQDKFFMYGYAGLGAGRVGQSGVWVMSWSLPAPPDQETYAYEETAFGVSFAGTANARFGLSERFGIYVGFKAVTFPGAIGYAYIPESYYRHWNWPAISVSVWAGPSFSI
jgi:hypothetical protein